MRTAARERAIIVGAGVGGLSLALYLAQEGFEVDIFERCDQPGGRCGVVRHGDFRFDLGATLLLMPRLIESIFADWGEDADAHLRLTWVDPIYALHFENGESFRFSQDLDILRDELERHEPGAYDSWLRYNALGQRQYREVMRRVLTRNVGDATELFSLSNVLEFLRMRGHRQHYSVARDFFRSPALRTAFTFQNIYIGQSPFSASALWASISAMELAQGAWYPLGGMHAIVESLVRLSTRRGVRLHLGADVGQILIERGRATGICLTDGSSHSAGVVAVNADLPFAYRRLLPPSRAARRLEARRYTNSAIVFHWGLARRVDALAHHNVFFGDDYAAGFRGIFNGTRIAAQAVSSHFYVNRPTATDASSAPSGQDALTVIVPSARHDTRHPLDWHAIRASAREHVLLRLNAAGIGISPHDISFERCHTPPDWEKAFNLSHGSVFGSLDHGLDQVGPFRPANRHPDYPGLYFVGGSTHPGSGVPLVMLSARLTAERILADRHQHADRFLTAPHF